MWALLLCKKEQLQKKRNMFHIAKTVAKETYEGKNESTAILTVFARCGSFPK
jgi:hypothetical protein